MAGPITTALLQASPRLLKDVSTGQVKLAKPEGGTDTEGNTGTTDAGGWEWPTLEAPEFWNKLWHASPDPAKDDYWRQVQLEAARNALIGAGVGATVTGLRGLLGRKKKRVGIDDLLRDILMGGVIGGGGSLAYRGAEGLAYDWDQNGNNPPDEGPGFWESLGNNVAYYTGKGWEYAKHYGGEAASLGRDYLVDPVARAAQRVIDATGVPSDSGWTSTANISGGGLLGAGIYRFIRSNLDSRKPLGDPVMARTRNAAIRHLDAAKLQLQQAASSLQARGLNVDVSQVIDGLNTLQSNIGNHNMRSFAQAVRRLEAMANQALRRPILQHRVDMVSQKADPAKRLQAMRQISLHDPEFAELITDVESILGESRNLQEAQRLRAQLEQLEQQKRRNRRSWSRDIRHAKQVADKEQKMERLFQERDRIAREVKSVENDLEKARSHAIPEAEIELQNELNRLRKEQQRIQKDIDTTMNWLDKNKERNNQVRDRSVAFQDYQKQLDAYRSEWRQHQQALQKVKRDADIATIMANRSIKPDETMPEAIARKLRHRVDNIRNTAMLLARVGSGDAGALEQMLQHYVDKLDSKDARAVSEAIVDIRNGSLTPHEKQRRALEAAKLIAQKAANPKDAAAIGAMFDSWLARVQLAAEKGRPEPTPPNPPTKAEVEQKGHVEAARLQQEIQRAHAQFEATRKAALDALRRAGVSEERIRQVERSGIEYAKQRAQEQYEKALRELEREASVRFKGRLPYPHRVRGVAASAALLGFYTALVEHYRRAVLSPRRYLSDVSPTTTTPATTMPSIE